MGKMIDINEQLETQYTPEEIIEWLKGRNIKSLLAIYREEDEDGVALFHISGDTDRDYRNSHTVWDCMKVVLERLGALGEEQD